MQMKEVDFLGDPKLISDSQLKQLNQNLLKNPSINEIYCNFMIEYEALGHMKKNTI